MQCFKPLNKYVKCIQISCEIIDRFPSEASRIKKGESLDAT